MRNLLWLPIVGATRCWRCRDGRQTGKFAVFGIRTRALVSQPSSFTIVRVHPLTIGHQHIGDDDQQDSIIPHIRRKLSSNPVIADVQLVELKGK
jgi:hypothetical protein